MAGHEKYLKTTGKVSTYFILFFTPDRYINIDLYYKDIHDRFTKEPSKLYVINNEQESVLLKINNVFPVTDHFQREAIGISPYFSPVKRFKAQTNTDCSYTLKGCYFSTRVFGLPSRGYLLNQGFSLTTFKEKKYSNYKHKIYEFSLFFC